MKRAVMHLMAGLAGFVMGLVLTTSPMAWSLAGTRVTWDASSCPDGVYTITSMARSPDNGRTHVTSSSNVTLPSPEVVQEFSGLPAGTFSVTAVARRSDGTQFESRAQTIVSAGDGVIIPPTPTPTPTITPDPRNRQRPAADPSMGRAQPRVNPNGVIVQPAQSRSGSGDDMARVETTGKTVATSTLLISKSDLETIRIQLSDVIDPESTEPSWRRISLVDSDADGLTDVVLVEMANGDVRVWRLR